MCGYVVRLVQELVNETNLAPGSIAGSGPSGGGRIMEVETGVDDKLMEVGRVFGK